MACTSFCIHMLRAAGSVAMGLDSFTGTPRFAGALQMVWTPPSLRGVKG